jgi:putative transposase
MARGNGRQHIARDDDDRRRLQADLGGVVSRCSWKVYAFVLLSNHLHLVLKTPEPNLARGKVSTYGGSARSSVAATRSSRRRSADAGVAMRCARR